MKRAQLTDMTIEQLVARFVEITLAQDEAIMRDENAKYSRLFYKMEDVKEELKAREGDQRKALMRLYNHPNPQVRLKAIKATLAVAPKRARRMLEILAESNEYPQSGEAGMSIVNLDRGIFKPT